MNSFDRKSQQLGRRLGYMLSFAAHATVAKAQPDVLLPLEAAITDAGNEVMNRE